MAKGIKDIARLAGVSTTTVSHVMNNTRFVSEERRKRVQQAMARLNYRPNRLARGLRSKKSYAIGVILPDITNPYFAEVARGVEDACFENNYSAIICNSDDNPKIELHYMSMLAEKQMDGIVLVNVGEYGQKPPESIARAIPFVMLAREVHDFKADSIQVDNRLGGRMAAEYLFNLGHRRVACIGGTPQVYPSWDRVDGFIDYMRGVGYPLPARMVLKGNFQAESGYTLTRKMMAGKNKPTAIFAANDLMAYGAVRALTQAGFAVPGEVSVVGFDDISLSALFNPPLTTVRQPRLDMGGAAVKLLLERMEKHDLEPQRLMLPLELVVRQTSGPA
ncbi:MAG: LacI family transcriptional regulator [Planctomycetes bacterium]|nr:LacI family transcriptional regulator [Planctomycetota bacterium]